MRKLIFSAFMVASSISLYAQKLEDVQKNISEAKYADAQAKIDKILSEEKGQKNANAWYTKAIVYYNLSLDSTRTDKDYRGESYNALRKYYEMDPKNVMGTADQNARIFQLYDGFYNAGIRDFNAQKFASSFQNFRNALSVEDYIAEKKFTYPGVNLPALDTPLILNTAAAASKATLEDSAMAYYKRLADAKIKEDKYIEIYQLLVNYYDKKGDQANKQKYLTLGQELYPGDAWYEIELAGIRSDKPKLFDKYAQLTAANPNSYYLNYNYAVELYNYIYATDKKPADAVALGPKLESAIKNSIKVDTSANSNLLMIRLLTGKQNDIYDSLSTVTGTKPEDTKKRATMRSRIGKLSEEMVPYAQSAIDKYAEKDSLTPTDKAQVKLASNVLIDYYTEKKQLDKVKEYNDKLKKMGV